MKRQAAALLVAAGTLGVPRAFARPMTLPDGAVIEVYDTGNQNWPRQAMLVTEPPTVREWQATALEGLPTVADPEAGSGTALTMGRGESLAWRAEFPKPSTYQVAVYAKAAPGTDPVRDRSFMTLKVGDAAPILMQIAFRDRYACVAQFAFHVDAPGALDLQLAVTADSGAAFALERIRLIDQLGNCLGTAAKTRQVLFTPEEIAAVRREARSAPVSARTPAEWQARYEAIWRMPPAPHLPLIPQHHQLPELNPRTGAKARWDLYPGTGARRSVARTQVTDLKTGEVFPNADFPDNGWGWLSAADRAAGHWKNTYHFVAWHTGAGDAYQDTVDSWPNLHKRALAAARSYFETGDPGHGREAVVMLATLARHYPLLMYNSLSLQNLWAPATRFSPFDKGTGWMQGAWQNVAMAELAVAYEQIFPFLHPEAPADVVAFVGGKVPWVQTAADLRGLLETNLIQYSADCAIRRHYLGANGIWEDCLATFAVVQQDPDTVRPWLEQLWTRAYFGINEGGLPDLIVNANLREGANLIGQANYAKATALLAKTAFNLRRWVEAGGDATYDIADTTRHPKLLAACFFPLDIRVAGGFQTNIGEGYNHAGIGIRGYPDAEDKGSRAAYRLAYEATGDPRCAWILQALGREGEPDALWARIQAAAASVGEPFRHTRTRQLPGFGLSILESGSAETDLARKAALIMLGSIRVGHAHADTLDIELFARGARISPDIATRYARIGYLTRGHNLVEVDAANFVNLPVGNPSGTGWIEALHDGGWIRFTQGAGRAALQPQVQLYRRSAALVDTPAGAYVVDVFRARGGKLHTWCFHTQYANEFACTLDPATSAPTLRAYVESVDAMKLVESGVAPAVLTTDYTCAAGLAPGVAGPVRVRSRLFGVQGLSVAVGVEAEGGKLHAKDRAIRFLFVRREGEDLASRWLHVIEPYGDTPLLADVEELPVADSANSAALRVTTAAGRRDLIVYNDTGKPIDAGGMTTDALFACAAFGADQRIEGLYLFGGSEWRGNGWTLKAERRAHEATVLAVDPLSNTVTLDAPLPAAAVGQALAVGAPPHQSSFDIVGVAGNEVRLQGTARVYQSPVLRVEGRRVTTELQLVLKTADPDYYVGLAAANGEHSTWWTVTATPRDEAVVAAWADKTMPTDVRWSLDCQLELDREATIADFPVVDGRPMLYLYDFGPGAKVRLPAAVALSRAADGTFTIRSNVGVTLEGPDAGTPGGR